MNILLNLTLVAAACIGHTAVWVFLVNRAYARAINYRVLRRLRMIPESLICLFPFALLLRLSLADADFLQGGPIGDTSALTQLMLLAPLPAFVLWLPVVVRWHVWLKHQFAISDHAERYDLISSDSSAEETSQVRGTGPGIFALWPWNEIFQLEVNEKTIEVTSSDASRSGTELRIVHFSDLHFVGCPGPAYYRQVMRRAMDLKPDAFIFTGDLIDDPDLLPVACEILAEVCDAAPSFFILGNHDWRYDVPAIRSALTETGWVDVGSRSVTFDVAGLRVGVSGSEQPWIGSCPEKPRGCDVSLLLSHSPDQWSMARDAGFDVMFSGHTHGGQVVLPIAGPVFSPSCYGTRYASGLFREGALQFHVSRGVGAKDSVRWNCLPEVTLLKLCFVEADASHAVQSGRQQPHQAPVASGSC